MGKLLRDKTCIEWIDACEFHYDADEFKRMIKYGKGEEYLVVKKTYGIIYKIPRAYCVVMEESSDGEKQVTIIPDRWILKIS